MSARLVCGRCRRPQVVCWCDHLPQLPTRTRILILQHPREREVGIGTARMAHLALPGSTLRVGIDFSRDPAVAGMLEGAALLFPGPDTEVASPKTLIVVDGTWAQARGLVKKNPFLQTLPRIGFVPRQPSQYRIRREPADFCVSTIEALAEVLRLLEGGDFDALLDPFRAMVDKQEWYRTEVRANRHRPHEKKRQRRPSLNARLLAAWPRLVCLQGEANGWPMHDPARQDPEIVHFTAVRPASGERYQAVIAPRRPLAPLTPFHIDLDAERLHTGVTVGEWHQSWSDFLRPDDVVVQWGRFYSKLAIDEGLRLPAARIDLRGELSQLRERGSTLEECTERLAAAPEPPLFDGRAGRRLAALTALVRALAV